VRLKCKRLQFLHAAAFGSDAEEGKQIGSYFVHYVGNPARLEIPIVYGQDLANWRAGANDKAPNGCKVAWSAGRARLFLTSWVNLLPDAEIESIDFVSSVGDAAPFLVAISAD
jgi:hypothetical protein